MRRKGVGFLIALFALPGFLPAQTFSSSGSVLQSLNARGDARASALGGAFSAVADDPDAVDWNPAGLAWIPHMEIQTTYNQWFLDTFYQDLAGVVPTSFGGIGARISYVNFGSFDNRDLNDNLVGSQTPQAWAWSMAAAAQFGELGFGLSVKADQESYAGYGVGGLGLDAGALWRMKKASFSLGVRNVGEASSYSLPTEFYVGGATGLGPPSFYFQFSTDITFPDSSPIFHHGIEWEIDKTFFLRGGYQWALQTQQSQDQAGFGGGAGLHLGDFQLDFSTTSYGALGTTDKITVGYIFERQIHKTLSERVKVEHPVAPAPTTVVVASPAPASPLVTPTPIAQTAPVVAAPAVVPTEGMLVLYKRGVAEYKDGHYRLAGDDLRKAVSINDPKVAYYYYSEAYNMLGILYQYHAKYEGHLKTAEEYFRAALKKEPGNLTALKHLKELEKK